MRNIVAAIEEKADGGDRTALIVPKLRSYSQKLKLVRVKVYSTQTLVIFDSGAFPELI